MKEDIKKKLYVQIKEMYDNNENKDNAPILAEEEYLELSDHDALEYIFKYRDKLLMCPRNENGQEQTYSIELPSMTITEDMSDIYISDFVLGHRDEKGDIEYSHIDLEGTGAIINLSSIVYLYNKETKYLEANFNNCNFNGCKVFGRLQEGEFGDKFQKRIYEVIYSDEKFPREYIERRKGQLDSEKNRITDKIYEKMKNGEPLDGLRGINTLGLSMSDYDFTEFDITNFSNNYIEKINKNNIDISYTGLGIEQGSRDLIGNEMFYYRDKRDLLYNAIKSGEDIEYIEKLLRYGANPNYRYKTNRKAGYETPVHIAGNNKEIVKLLLKYGLNIEGKAWVDDSRMDQRSDKLLSYRRDNFRRIYSWEYRKSRKIYR